MNFGSKNKRPAGIVINTLSTKDLFIILKLGTNKWYFYNDNACINERNIVSTNMYAEDINFSTCGSSDFNCFDGTW